MRAVLIIAAGALILFGSVTLAAASEGRPLTVAGTWAAGAIICAGGIICAGLAGRPGKGNRRDRRG